MEKKITYIPITELYAHPDNPRKDVGDVEELAESIKVKGILQNLTVVKGHAQTHEEWSNYNKQYDENPSEELRDKINSKWYEDGYTVIIGHRRMAAAKLAGLTELPCVITEMTPQEQVATMLLENMQRSDLTVYEQAKGFQMMLDFGETVESVAEKSGFSQTTVRRRIKLLDLDEEKFKKSEARNVSLFEYMELDKIKNIELKNRVLDFVGTANFNNELQKAISEETLQEYLDNVKMEISKFATETDDISGLSWVCEYGGWNKREVVVPDDCETAQYFYKCGYKYIALYKKKEVTPADEEAERIKAEKEADKERRKDGLRDASERAFALREEAIGLVANSHIIRHLSDIVEFYYKKHIKEWGTFNTDDIVEILGIDTEDEEFDNMSNEEFEEILKAEIEKQAKEKPGVLLLKAIYAEADDSERNNYYDYYGQHSKNEELNDLYDMLCKLGYGISDEEKALRDGTHELFVKEDTE